MKIPVYNCDRMWYHLPWPVYNQLNSLQLAIKKVPHQARILTLILKLISKSLSKDIDMSAKYHGTLLGDLPNKLYIACSGGVDSVFALSFLTQVPQRDVSIIFFDHGTKTSAEALTFLKSYLLPKFQLNLKIGTITCKKPKGKSKEEHWRDERYKFLTSITIPIVMAHHLDDQIETWLFGAMHGRPKTIPYRRDNVIRPFLLFRKDMMINWCIKRDIRWIKDKTNDDLRYMRNLIRHKIIPEALKVNPGLHKVVARKVIEKYSYEEEKQGHTIEVIS